MKFLLFIYSTTFTAEVYACTLCNSETAKEIRASFFNSDLPYNLIVIILPFIIFSGIAYFIYHGGFKKKDRINKS